MKIKRWKKWLLVLAGAIFLFAVMILGINGWMKASVKEQILSPEKAASQKVDCILILGAGIKEDGTLSPMLRERLEAGIQLYEENVSDRLLMSGDHGREDYNEAAHMKAFAIEEGVPSEKIFMDHAGFSTYESIYRARDVFQAKKIMIVTQKYHLSRALYIAQRLGLDAWGVSADQTEYRGWMYREAREMLARTKDFFSTIFQPKPTYLGEAIPVNGDGNVTND